jgi:predicted phosphodiesterase
MSNVDWELAMKRAAEGWSNYRISDLFGVHESTIRRGLRDRGYQRHLIPTDHTFVDRFRLELDQPLYVTGDIAITADWHVPLYDPEYVNKFILSARERGHNRLILAGDFFNFDALSAYEPKQSEAGLAYELKEAEAVMRVLLETFDEIYYIWGNHDARLHRALGFTIQFSEAMRLVLGELGHELLNRITFTNLDHIWVEGRDGVDWYVCHPANYSRIPLSNSQKLSAKYNANVITAHSHHCAVGYAVDGKKVVAEIGGLFDKDSTAYLQRSTTFPTWQQGFAFLEGGKLIVDSPGWELA